MDIIQKSVNFFITYQGFNTFLYEDPGLVQGTLYPKIHMYVTVM